MKSFLPLLFTFLPLFLIGQYADFTGTGTSGTGVFPTPSSPSPFSDFTYSVTGAVDESNIDFSEYFTQSNNFETTFGEADNAENINARATSNTGSIGDPITGALTLSINFTNSMPSSGWGFALKDLDVDQAVISATDNFDNPVTNAVINSWLDELFDAVSGGTNIPKWDGTNAALLGANTPVGYTVYDNTIIGSLTDTESGTGTFRPNVSLNSLTLRFENVTLSSTPSFHFYMAASETALPVELSRFNANYNEEAHLTKLNWVTESELNNEKFVVEYSKNGNTFDEIAEVLGLGTSIARQEYSFSHLLSSHDYGTLYYRLKQIDFDGQNDYSEIVSVNVEEDSYQIYPTVVSQGEEIIIRNKTGIAAEFEMYDLNGRLVRVSSNNNNTLEQRINTDLLPSGIYCMKMKQKSIKIIIQN